MALITPEEFGASFQKCGFSKPASRHYDILMRRLPESGITDKTQLAMLLANVMQETGGLHYIREITPSPSFGNYFGRGYIQLTHDYNYRDASKALFGDDRLLQNPDLVAQDEELAWRTALWFWKARVRGGQFGAQVAAGDFDGSIRAINSGELKNPGNKQAENRRKYYRTILGVFGISGVVGGTESHRVSSSASGGGRVHVVQGGETLTVIAQRYGTSSERIARDNGIVNPNLIHPGQRLIIN